MTSRRRARLLGLLLTGALALPVAGAAPAAAAEGACPGSTGVTVVVDFQALGGATLVRCAPGPVGSGFEALTAAGLDHRETARAAGFLCRIEGEPASDPCLDASPADAYWSYWHAERGAATWTYSELGASSRQPPPGTVEGWSFVTDPARSDTTPPGTPPPAPPAPPPASGTTATGAGPAAGPTTPPPPPPATGAPRRSTAPARAAAPPAAADDPSPASSTSSPAPSVGAAATPSPTASLAPRQAEAVVGPTGAATATEPAASASPSASASPAASAEPAALTVEQDREGAGGVPTSTLVGLGAALALGGGAGATALRRRGSPASGSG